MFIAETVYALTIISFVLHLVLFDYPGIHISANEAAQEDSETQHRQISTVPPRTQMTEHKTQQPTLKPSGNTDLGVGLE
eukprot:SAG31_NODE_29751_length_390_cov_0.993127_1_plen_78_part_10